MNFSRNRGYNTTALQVVNNVSVLDDSHGIHLKFRTKKYTVSIFLNNDAVMRVKRHPFFGGISED
jgi:hypothetical protein